jgi:hypothetical protein
MRPPVCYDAASATLLARVYPNIPVVGADDGVIKYLCSFQVKRLIGIETATALVAFHRRKPEDQVTVRWHQLTTTNLSNLYVRSRRPALLLTTD